jgi:hypothetical protein
MAEGIIMAVSGVGELVREKREEEVAGKMDEWYW